MTEDPETQRERCKKCNEIRQLYRSLKLNTRDKYDVKETTNLVKFDYEGGESILLSPDSLETSNEK